MTLHPVQKPAIECPPAGAISRRGQGAEEGVWRGLEIRFLATSCLALTIGTAGCFFTSGINSEPQAQIETVDPGPYLRNTSLALTAYKSDDPDGDRLEVDWRAFTCSADRSQCDAPAFATLSDVEPGEHFVFTVPPRRVNQAVDEPTVTITVVATVHDEHGASHEDRLFVDISNRDPEVTLQAQGAELTPGSNAFPIGSFVRIEAEFEDPDGDGMSYEWSYTGPLESDDANVGFRRISDTSYELEPDVEGLWSVQVTATDELGAATMGAQAIAMEPDRLPCIDGTDPLAQTTGRYVLDWGGLPRRFAVASVDDDLDAYPPHRGEPYYESARFRWFLASPDTDGALVQLLGHGDPDHLVDPRLFAPGDRLSLRVEIDDRAAREIVCGPESPTCSLSGDACLQRVTWELEIR